ncbi:MAG TPA: DNA polymerase ligase N-terminal domain-containing protein, partial [Polyangiaceae bacterium]|nr:DNA polymerase ligase N-terminal domain-containing protein [Polyangiaceae bacterium]
MAGGDGKSASELGRYRGKRDPGRTTEPFEPERPVRGETETRAGRFVVHQHAASRMHWDVRLQIGASLLSFAVPKGPSLDPADKRLAVHTENHPLAYLDFEDVIPPGNYGAGAMIAWDTGGLRYLETTAEEGLTKGKLDFWLSGFKLNGRFALILTTKGKQKGGVTSPHGEPQQQEWLLVKKPDAHAKPGHDLLAAQPRSVLSGLTVEELAKREEVRARLLASAEALGATRVAVDEPRLVSAPPMVCALEGAPERSADWLYELKLDGVRVVAHKQGDNVRLRYRSGLACTSNYPEIVRAVRSLPVEELTLDGEIVTFDERGRPHFGMLAPRFAARKAADIARARAEVPVAYLCFDVLALGGFDLRELPLIARKGLLGALLRGSGYVRALDHIVERGDALAALCESEELEGIVAKRAASPYRHGPEVSGNWVKLKRAREEEFVVIGKSEGKGARKELGALLLASYAGERLVYRGKVGSGLDGASISALGRLLGELPALAGDVEFIP